MVPCNMGTPRRDSLAFKDNLSCMRHNQRNSRTLEPVVFDRFKPPGARENIGVGRRALCRRSLSRAGRIMAAWISARPRSCCAIELVARYRSTPIAFPMSSFPKLGRRTWRASSRLSGIKVGDFSVVIACGRVVPVIVADNGPYSKLGEGSLALHRALGHEQCAAKAHGVCSRVNAEGQSMSSNVTPVLFPGIARPGLTPDTISAIIRREGERLWRQLLSATSKSRSR